MTLWDPAPDEAEQEHSPDSRGVNTLAGVADTRELEACAAVTYPAPHGTESFVLSDGTTVEFGRGGTCPIRFAYAPVADECVPRVAGRLVVASERVFVEATDAAGRSALEILTDGRPPVLVAAGDAFAPREQAFTVTVRGTNQNWLLHVVVRPRVCVAVEPGVDAPTKVHALALSDRERRVVEAYVAPLIQGRLEPATHNEVAQVLHYHPNSAREVLYDVWSKLFAAGVPMPDVTDKRVAVAEAVRLHRLLDTTT